MRHILATAGTMIWFALNGVLWYSHPTDLVWFICSAVLGIVGFVAFFWYVTLSD